MLQTYLFFLVFLYRMARVKDYDKQDAKPFVEIDLSGRYVRLRDQEEVHRAFDQEEGIQVAWNQVTLKNFSNDPAMMERLYYEVRLFRSLNHKNIITLYKVWRDEKHNTLNFITKVCTSENLRENW